MIKLDLITGFLGAGKTTFLKYYAKYFLRKGEKICIIENDFGAINIDRVLLQDLEGDNCNLEMIVGGDGAEAHKRRLKTKLISMAMLGFDRVIVEPSGIFDVDEFFDLVYEEPLDRWYEIGNVIAILDPGVVKSLSDSSRNVLVSELAQAGTVVISRSDEYSVQMKAEAADMVNSAMLELGCQHDLTDKLIIDKNFGNLDDKDFDEIVKRRFNHNSHVKVTGLGMSEFQTFFYFDFAMEINQLKNTLTKMLNDNACGNIHRVKGVVDMGDGRMVEINSTRYGISTNTVNSERAVLIVIGENINVNELEKYLGKPTL